MKRLIQHLIPSALLALASVLLLANPVSANGLWTVQVGSVARQWVAMASSGDGTRLVGAETGGKIYTSIDSGVTWVTRTSANKSWTAVTSSLDGKFLAATESFGNIYTSSDFGETWVTRNTANRIWTSITSSHDGKFLAATETNGKIYTSDDYGVTWPARNTANRLWSSIASSSDGKHLAAAVAAGQIWTSDNYGDTWTARPSGSRAWDTVASSSDGVSLAATVNNGKIYTSNDAGVTWVERVTANRVWTSIASSSNGTRLAATEGVKGKIYTSFDSGLSWTPQEGAGERAWTAITMNSSGSLLQAFGAGVRVWSGVLPPPTYTLSFDKQGLGPDVEPSSGINSLAISDLPRLLAAGFTFLGWSDSSTGSVLAGELSLSSDTTLYARWSPNSFQVTFNTKGGSAVASGSLVANGSITTPAAPTRIGYDFQGWSSTDGGSALTFPYNPAVLSDTTLYALWSAASNSVNFNTQGGSVVPIGSYLTEGSVAEPTAPTRVGYTFEGWSSSDGGSAVEFPHRPSTFGDLTLYALWSAKSHSVIFSTKGGSPIPSGSFVTDGPLVAPTVPTRIGYTFNGWSITDSGSVVVFPFIPNVVSNLTLYANWSLRNYAVTYHSKGGTPVVDGSFASGGNVAAPSAPTRTGHTFRGWSATDGGSALRLPYKPRVASDVDLYAIWSVKTFRVSFDSNGGSKVKSDIFIYGGSVESEPSAPRRMGYVFSGWSPTPSGSTISFPYSSGAAENIILYAKWIGKDLRVTFKSKPGVIEESGPTVTGGTVTQAPSPTRTGYVLIGWSLRVSGGNLISFPFVHGRITDFTLYAQWIAKA
jgi:uncharacterized repeat protein (TIGR02543 family)